MRHVLHRPSYITVSLLVVGLWLVISPVVLGLYDQAVVWGNTVIAGVVLMAMAVIRHTAREYFMRVRWTLLVVGSWMIAHPFLGGYQQYEAALYNAVITGMVIVVITIAAVAVPGRSQTERRG